PAILTPAPTPPLYTLSLHDALPISARVPGAGHGAAARARARGDGVVVRACGGPGAARRDRGGPGAARAGARPSRADRPRVVRPGDRKSTRLNSSHVKISYAVFCLKK